jgi:hypothetical protein
MHPGVGVYSIGYDELIAVLLLRQQHGHAVQPAPDLWNGRSSTATLSVVPRRPPSRRSRSTTWRVLAGTRLTPRCRLGRSGRATSAPLETTAPQLALQKSRARGRRRKPHAGTTLPLRNWLGNHPLSATERCPSSSKATKRQLGQARPEITGQHRLRSYRPRCRVESPHRPGCRDRHHDRGVRARVRDLRRPSRVREGADFRADGRRPRLRPNSGSGGRPYYERRLLRPVRISLIRISGCSKAAKCPPFLASP